MAVLRAVELDSFTLETDINDILTSWRLPDCDLLSHKVNGYGVAITTNGDNVRPRHSKSRWIRLAPRRAASFIHVVGLHVL